MNKFIIAFTLTFFSVSARAHDTSIDEISNLTGKSATLKPMVEKIAARIISGDSVFVYKVWCENENGGYYEVMMKTVYETPIVVRLEVNPRDGTPTSLTCIYSFRKWMLDSRGDIELKELQEVMTDAGLSGKLSFCRIIDPCQDLSLDESSEYEPYCGTGIENENWWALHYQSKLRMIMPLLGN